MKKLMEKDANKRLGNNGAHEVKKHAWFKVRVVESRHTQHIGVSYHDQLDAVTCSPWVAAVVEV